MPSKMETYSELADRTLSGLTARRGAWTGFLDSAAWLYKYPFHDQVMIHAQRPDARTCAELPFWNEKYNRRVRRGSRGIALIDDGGPRPRLRYVFDAGDTEESLYGKSRPVSLWEINGGNEKAVISGLSKNHDGVSADGTLAGAIDSIARQLAGEYYDDNFPEILYHAEGSILEPAVSFYDIETVEQADDTALGTAFRGTLASSIAYAVMARMGLDTEDYFDDEDFRGITDFNTPDMATALGMATSELAGQVLKEIAGIIRGHERAKHVENAERRRKDGEKGTDLHAGRGLPDPRHQAPGTASGADATAGQVRTHEDGIPQGTQKNYIRQADPHGEAVPTPAGGGRNGGDTYGADDGSRGREEGPARQGIRPADMGGGYEQPAEPGGGDDTGRTDLRLDDSYSQLGKSPKPGPAEPMTDLRAQTRDELSGRGFAVPDELIEDGISDHHAPGGTGGHRDIADYIADEYLTEEERHGETTTGETTTPIQALLSTSSINTDEVDSILRDGGNSRGSILRMAARFAKGLAGNGDFLRDEYLCSRYGRRHEESGKGFLFGDKRVSAWFSEDGISLDVGTTARHNINRVLIPWETAAARIDALVREGIYVSKPVLDNALDNELRELAYDLWNFYRDDMKHIPEEWRSPHGGHPEDMGFIKAQLDDSDMRQSILDRLEADVARLDQDNDRRRWHDPSGLPGKMRTAMIPPAVTGAAATVESREHSHFITQDEIDAIFTAGRGHEGKLETLSFFLGNHDDKEKADFMKKQHGHGGGTWGATDGWCDAEPGKGITLSRGPASNPTASVTLKWNAAAKRTDQLIRGGQYMTRAELDAIPGHERLMLVRSINNFFHGLPDGHKRPFEGKTVFHPNEYHDENGERTLDFYHPGEAERQAIRDLLDDPARVDALLSQMGDILENTLADDRRHEGRKECHKALLAYRAGTYTLFPGVENLPDPETVAARRERRTETSERGIVVDMREAGAGWPADTMTTEAGQMSLFDLGLAARLPGTEEQDERIRQSLERQETPGTETPEPFAEDGTGDKATPAIPKTDFRITDDHLGEGGAKTKYKNNIRAIETLKTIETEDRPATPEEQETLSRYVGWGGIQEAFDPDKADWRDEHEGLKSLLTPGEWESARASTLNAHYTSPTVIRAMYGALGRMGFKSGNVLEPACGAGNFFGLLPDAMRGSRLYGVELDGITARIASLLYPGARIQETGYEKTDYPDAFFDLAVGNVPFGAYGVVDKRYKTEFYIHDYFFQKTLDKLRPGGIIAFVTSKGTLDKKNPAARKYIAERAELMGAVRLPNTAFKKNAGTDATTDIIFLKKRDRPVDVEPEWVHLGLDGNGLAMNRHFIDHPEMILGTMTKDAGLRMYGAEDSTTCEPMPGADLAEQLEAALSLIDGEYGLEEPEDIEGVDSHAIPADPRVKNHSYALVTPDGTGGRGIRAGRVYFRENSRMYPVNLPAVPLGRIRGMIGLRECVDRLIDLQLNEHGDDEIRAQQAALNTAYDAFVAEHGRISSRANSRAFGADNSYYLLASLEILDEEGEFARKADMFTERTIRQKKAITRVDTATEALAVSIGEKARVDPTFMQSLTDMDMDKMIADLQGIIFRVPKQGIPEWQAADEYLSGNVRAKLETAKEYAAEDPGFAPNVTALTAVLPKDLEAGEITVRLGATWIKPEYVHEFMHGLLGSSEYYRDAHRVRYHGMTGEWQVTGKNRATYGNIATTVTYGTKRANAFQIIDDSLNLRDVRIYDHVTGDDGKEKRVLNRKETMLAQQKQELIKAKFRDWIWADAGRRRDLVAEYNTLFNSTRPREYDGSHLVLSGINPTIELNAHQLNGVARQIYGGNTLFAHVVGAGKTFTMAASAMEGKRVGLCEKSLFAVPNHLTEQWAAEFLRLYPSANILVAMKKDFETRNRRKFCAKIATGAYDAVIIGHSQLEKIPMSRERQERQLAMQLAEVEEGIRELKAEEGTRYTVKQYEKVKRGLEKRLTKLLDGKTRDDVVTFEQLGVDRLYVDEAHNFKNLFLYTKMRNVAGLSTSEAQKSSDLYMKCRYMDELTGNRGVVFATGTPISNSMSEMYTMQRYLQHDTLAERRLSHFDSWASIFGETVTSIELAPEGTGYRARTRFARFHNLPELMTLFKEVADIQTADMLMLPVPAATYENIIAEPSDIQKEMVAGLSERAALVQRGMVDPRDDNMLKITTDGRKIGLDQRLMTPLLPDHDGSKVNLCAENVYCIWDETHHGRLTQLVFCDFSTPKKDGRFNVYDDIRWKLLERGVPEDEVAFIHDADTEVKKKELFARVRQGKVRILFGSTFKMGAGTNVQDRLVAIHDLDCPWRPADLEQRGGRMIRQGNMNEEVTVYRYATSGTFDSYLWQTVQKKQEFIAQIMSSKSPMRSCEDVDATALSYAEIKALCAGNPLIAEKMNLDVEVAKLRMLKSEHKSQHYRLEDDMAKRFPEQAASLKERIAGMERDIAAYSVLKEKCTEIKTDENGNASVSVKFPGMTVGGTFYAERGEAAPALLESCKGAKGRLGDVEAGEYMGFKLGLQYESLTGQVNILLRGAITYKAELGTDAHGNITRINNTLDRLPERLEGLKDSLGNLRGQMEAAKKELAIPFAHEDELAAKERRLAELDTALNIDGGDAAVDDGDMGMDDGDVELDDGDMTEKEDLDTGRGSGERPSIIRHIREHKISMSSDGQGKRVGLDRAI